MVASVPKPSAAAPPAKNVKRAGLASKHDGSQHSQTRKNLRRVELALIPASRSLSDGSVRNRRARPTITVVGGLFQAGPTRYAGGGAASSTFEECTLTSAGPDQALRPCATRIFLTPGTLALFGDQPL